MRPLIGITTSYDLDKRSDPPRGRVYLPAAYSDAIYAAGGLPYPFAQPATSDTALFDDLVARVDGLLFTGGYDLDPRHYGQPQHPATHIMHPRRDAFELAFFRYADAARVPILAICLGFQVAHVARGGRLIQHVDDLDLRPRVVHHRQKDRDAFHSVRLESESRLAEVVGATQIEVNSRHHQAVQAAGQGRGLRPVGFSLDGLVEGSEDCDGRFLLAVQWHPENLIDRPEHLRLFAALVAAAT